MIDIKCDESHDQHTYALGGWIATPSAWDHFDGPWLEMLGRHPMPDGSPMPAFHASEIVGRDHISDSRWKGWTFEQEKAAFSDAVDQITNRELCANMWAVGVSVPMPFHLDTPLGKASDDDAAIWMFLFVRLFFALLEKYPAQNGFTFLFDEKPEIMELVSAFYAPAKEIVNSASAGKLAGSAVGFAPDHEAAPLQAADLFIYEWRRRVTDRQKTPGKPARLSAVDSSVSARALPAKMLLNHALQEASSLRGRISKGSCFGHIGRY